MDRTQSKPKRPSASHERSRKGIRTLLRGMIRTGMFVEFLLEELKLCRTEAEKEVVFSVLCGAKARMRHLQKMLKRHLVSEPFKTPGPVSVIAEGQVDFTSAAVLPASA